MVVAEEKEGRYSLIVAGYLNAMLYQTRYHLDRNTNSVVVYSSLQYTDSSMIHHQWQNIKLNLESEVVSSRFYCCNKNSLTVG